MPEILLHYIWQQRLWADMPQATTDNQPVEILSVGRHNRDAGPDFSHARVRIGTHEWVGNVEMHVRASDWRRHRHHTNPAYDNVVLHVVCEADEPTYNTRGECIPNAYCVIRTTKTTLPNSSPMPSKWILYGQTSPAILRCCYNPRCSHKVGATHYCFNACNADKRLSCSYCKSLTTIGRKHFISH